LDALAKKKDASYTVQQAHYLVGTLIHDEACVRFQARDHEDEPHKLKKRYEAYVVIVSVFYDVQDSLKPLLARRAVKFAANVLEAIHYLGELATLRPGQPIWSEGVKALQEVWHSYPGANYGWSHLQLKATLDEFDRARIDHWVRAVSAFAGCGQCPKRIQTKRAMDAKAKPVAEAAAKAGNRLRVAWYRLIISHIHEHAFSIIAI
jgi:hypothetical protein